MSGQQAMQQQQRPSRWDALNTNTDNGPSSSAPSSRRRPSMPNQGKPSKTSDRHNRPQWKVDRGGDQSSRPGNSDLGSWRRRATNDAVNTPPKPTEEDDQVRGAIKTLEIAITYFRDQNKDEIIGSTSQEPHNSIRHSVEQLATSLFGVTDSSIFIKQPLLHQRNSIKTLPDISNDVTWEAAYSLLYHLQLLSQPKEMISKRLQFLISISSLASACLQSFIHNQRHMQKEQSTRPKSMTDLCLCECASILLDILGCEGCSSFDDNVNGTKEILYKATLFLCLAKILSISSMDAPTSHSSPKNARGMKGALFPWGAEKTVNLIMKQTALPFLESFTKLDGTAASVSAKVDFSYGAMECLYCLLKDPNQDLSFENADQKMTKNIGQLSKHAAAILAPLIIDVLPDGKENQRTNPLRSRTLSVIRSFWERSYELVSNEKPSFIETIDQTMHVVMSCQCMTAALNALSVLRKSKGKNNQTPNSYEIDVSTVAQQLQSMIQIGGLQNCRRNFLNILTLLCWVYPGASASQWHLFLEQTGMKAQPLISMLEEGTSALGNEHYDDEAWVTLPSALRATSSLLNAMPLTLWIGGEGKSIRLREGTFSRRVRNALLNVLDCTLNMMTAIKDRISCKWLSNESTSKYASLMEAVIIQLAGLAGKTCAVLPFNGENSVLLQPASRLVQCAGEIYVHSAKTIVSNELVSKPEMDHTLMHKTMSNCANIITESLEADTGSGPAVRWLSDASSYGFIGLLLTDTCWKYPSSEDRMDMLSSVARGSPLTLAREPFNLASFCEVCAVQCKSQNDADSRIRGLKLIESFILGRRTFLAKCISNCEVFTVVPKTLCPLLLDALDGHSVAVRSCAVSSFGSLLKEDWVDLLLKDKERVESSSTDWAPLECILKLCSVNGEKNASVRASSCKAFGDICTACIGGTQDQPFTDDFVLSFTSKVCKAMANALTDESASVRSMALFAIGNTALALKDSCIARSPSMQLIFSSVCTCLGDKDEKVVANAIRSISHIAYFVYDPGFVSKSEYSTPQAVASYISLLKGLAAKIKFALDDAIGETPNTLTWRRRNGAKKLAWGSCTTLGMLLSYSNMMPCVDDVQLFESVLSNLFGCIQLSNTIIEKITAAAMNSLTGLPIALWQHLSARCDSIGRGLATCFGFLYERKSMYSHHHDMETLTNVLLVSAKKTDFCTLFLIQESVPFSVEFFYQWIVTREVDSSVLEEVASAVSSQDVEQMLDVSVAQMFLSRKIQQNRQHGSPCKINSASLALDENDYEDDDEL